LCCINQSKVLYKYLYIVPAQEIRKPSYKLRRKYQSKEKEEIIERCRRRIQFQASATHWNHSAIIFNPLQMLSNNLSIVDLFLSVHFFLFFHKIKFHFLFIKSMNKISLLQQILRLLHLFNASIVVYQPQALI
jgi:hypothetical protein